MLISIRDVSKSYKVGEIQTDALKNINLNVEQGEFVVILGPSGSGKSTLLHVSGGLDEVNQGENFGEWPTDYKYDLITTDLF